MTAAATAAAPAAPRRQRSTYSAVAVALHWLIAALILTNIGLAWWFTRLPPQQQFAWTWWHKSIGITVLLLSLVRIAWRLFHPPPALPSHMRAWERWAARANHLVFYVLMLGLPLSGWIMTSASVLNRLHPTTLFGLPWPSFPFASFGLVGSDQLHAVRKLFGATHEKLAWVAYAAITLHVAAALKHQLIDRDEVLAHMIPFLRRNGAA
jgi:cytochrome b561